MLSDDRFVIIINIYHMLSYYCVFCGLWCHCRLLFLCHHLIHRQKNRGPRPQKKKRRYPCIHAYGLGLTVIELLDMVLKISTIVTRALITCMMWILFGLFLCCKCFFVFLLTTLVGRGKGWVRGSSLGNPHVSMNISRERSLTCGDHGILLFKQKPDVVLFSISIIIKA